MRYVLLLAAVFLVGPAAALADDKEKAGPTVESLLPAKAVAYFRYDGYEPHKKAYDRTALGGAMREDLGEFLDHLLSFATDSITSSFEEKNPGDRQQLAASWAS